MYSTVIRINSLRHPPHLTLHRLKPTNMPTKLLTLLLLTVLLLPTASSNNVLSTALTAFRSIPQSIEAFFVLSQITLQFGQSVFIISTKSRLIKELFGGIEDLKACIQDPEHRWYNYRPWPWSTQQPLKTRDWCGCLIGPTRIFFSFALLFSEVVTWFVTRGATWVKAISS